MGSNASELLGIHPQVMESGLVLTREQQLHLQAPITREEITYALEDINDLKSLGCDDFNAYFQEKAWSCIGMEVTCVVLPFFKSNQMFKAINCTTGTLIPKVQHPSSIKEFRPISFVLCSINGYPM